MAEEQNEDLEKRKGKEYIKSNLTDTCAIEVGKVIKNV